MRRHSHSQGHVAPVMSATTRVSSNQKPQEQVDQKSGMVTRNPAPDASPPSVSSTSQTLTIKSA